MAQSVTTPNPFAVDPTDELPVGLQLTLRLRALIATGRLAAGERLPSVRQLAEWAGVNLNTVRGVYAGLEASGLVARRPRRARARRDRRRGDPPGRSRRPLGPRARRGDPGLRRDFPRHPRRPRGG